jgi:CHAT domain-containing protein
MTRPAHFRLTQASPVHLAVCLTLVAGIASGVAFGGDALPQDKLGDTKLEPGAVLERELAGGEAHIYSIELAGGQYAEIDVEQRGIDVVVQVLDAQGKVLADFDSESRTVGREQVGFVSDSTGVWSLRVKARYPKDFPGRYELRLIEVRSGNEKDREVYEAHRESTEAGTLSDAGKYNEAIPHLEQALEVGEKALGPDDAYVGALAIRLGRLLRDKGDYSRAQTMLERAVNISERRLGPEDPQTAVALDTLGLVFRSTGNSAKADELFQRAMEITQKSLGGGHPRMATYLMQMALQYQDRGDFGQAVPELQRALAIAEKTLEPDDFLSIALLHDLGDIYLNQDDLDHAEPLTLRALELMEKKYGPEHPNVATCLQNLGAIARERRQYARALELLWRAQKIREKTLGPQHPQSAALLLNIGNVYKDNGQYEKARELYQQSLGILEISAGPYHRLTLMALANLSAVYSAEGQPSRALEYQARVNQVVEKNIELNLAIGSERAKLAYAEWMAYRTDRALSLHLQEDIANKTAAEQAALILLQRKARVLDAMADIREVLRQHLGADDQRLLEELSATIAELAKVALNGPGKTAPAEYSKHLSSLEERREKLETEISRRSAGYFEMPSAVNLAAVQAAIPADAALIEFAVYRPFDPKAADTGNGPYGDLRYAAYVIASQGDLRWGDLGSAKAIDSAAGALREALRDPQRRDVRQLARALDQMVMQPVRELTGMATHLLISPDGALSLVPFEALLDQEGHFLVERYSTSYLTTGRDLLRMKVTRQSKSDPLIVANPFFGDPGTGLIAQTTVPAKATSRQTARRSITTAKDLSAVYFAPLAGTAQEARTIHSLFPEARVLTGMQVTESAFRKVEAPRILHIATHGFFLQDAGAAGSIEGRGATTQGSVSVQNPLLRAGLALSGANLSRRGEGNDDGILTAMEAANLNLWGTKLVTLSACDTGVGEVKNGEGVYGLRRAFFLAGTESLVMSLWPVSDYVTRELMATFYDGLKAGLGRSEALRRAQLAMLRHKGREHPFYWASFIQAGEWANLDGHR